MNYNELSIAYHLNNQGKLETCLKTEINNRHNLSIVYSPGVGAVSQLIANDSTLVNNYTLKGRTIAVISDGSAVLGLGNIGPEASMPVMEGKCALIKRFSGLDAWPIVLKTQDTLEIISTIKNIAPSFAGINLEDISAPRCFEIEEALQDIGIPVFHDDQHGTAIVVLAGLINSFKVFKKDFKNSKIVIVGVGAAGTAIAKLISFFTDYQSQIIMVDSKGILSSMRTDLNESKKDLLKITNPKNVSGDLKNALKEADVFIGVSAPDVLSVEMIKTMKTDPIIFALSNPVPEIMPDLALRAGAKIIATGRSDFPNQINNVLVFPGIFKGAILGKIDKITTEMKIKAAIALASLVQNPTTERIIPDVFEYDIASHIAQAIKK